MDANKIENETHRDALEDRLHRGNQELKESPRIQVGRGERALMMGKGCCDVIGAA